MNKAQRLVGLHLRLNNSIQEIAQRATDLQLPFFQCFLVRQFTGKLIQCSKEDITNFLSLRSHFEKLFLHGSYWVNLASAEHNGFPALKRELGLARKLEFTHIILHPGTAKGSSHYKQGIDVLAKALNLLLKLEERIKVVLENTAHGNLTVGSDLTDFYELRQKLDQPERISFCVDTSHAYAYGYDISDPAKQDEFIQLLDETMGIANIVLIHLNDTRQKLGSCIDKHEMIGKGIIGLKPIVRFITHQKLAHIPVLLELPELSEEEEYAQLELIRNV